MHIPKKTPNYEEIAKRNADKDMQLKKNDFIRKMLKTSKEEFNRLFGTTDFDNCLNYVLWHKKTPAPDTKNAGKFYI